MIALLCSVQAEAKQLIAHMDDSRPAVLGSRTLIQGTLANRVVLLCVGGMGKANAAHAAALLLTRSTPEALIIFGVGGAYPTSGAKVGDVALASEEIAGDEGVLTVEGFRDTEYIGIPLVESGGVRLFNRLPAQEKLVAAAHESITRSMKDVAVHLGRFVTLSTCTGTAARARELEKQFGKPLCENMEGAAAAQVAELHSVPWLEVRGISNIVEDRDLARWNIPTAADAAQEAVLRVLEGWAS